MLLDINGVFVFQLAAGLDKYRTDASLVIWDVNRTTESLTETGQKKKVPGPPIHEYGTFYMSIS